jgi:hypothetical protein
MATLAVARSITCAVTWFVREPEAKNSTAQTPEMKSKADMEEGSQTLHTKATPLQTGFVVVDGFGSRLTVSTPEGKWLSGPFQGESGKGG